MTDAINNFVINKSLTDNPIVTEVFRFTMDKYLFTQAAPDILPPQDHQGYLQLNSYFGQDYVVFADEYSVGSRQSTFNTL
jgi:hypothetical protein